MFGYKYIILFTSKPDLKIYSENNIHEKTNYIFLILDIFLPLNSMLFTRNYLRGTNFLGDKYFD